MECNSPGVFEKIQYICIILLECDKIYPINHMKWSSNEYSDKTGDID